MKSSTISLHAGRRFRTLHVEAPGCIVNIHFGLTDTEGRSVTNVSINADGRRYAGERGWFVATEDFENLNPRDIQCGLSVRVRRESDPEVDA